MPTNSITRHSRIVTTDANTSDTLLPSGYMSSLLGHLQPITITEDDPRGSKIPIIQEMYVLQALRRTKVRLATRTLWSIEKRWSWQGLLLFDERKKERKGQVGLCAAGMYIVARWSVRCASSDLLPECGAGSVVSRSRHPPRRGIQYTSHVTLHFHISTCHGRLMWPMINFHTEFSLLSWSHASVQ